MTKKSKGIKRKTQYAILLNEVKLNRQIPWKEIIIQDNNSTFAWLEYIELAKKFLPSKNISNKWSWICFMKQSYAERNQYKKDMNKFSMIPQNRKINNILNKRNMDIIAHEYQITSGKWMIFSTINKIETYWLKIVRAFVENLNDDITHIKISTKNDPFKNTHVICIYISNYLNNKQVVCVRKLLKNLDINEEMKFKPDIYTYLNIYRGNQRKIKPSLYSL